MRFIIEFDCDNESFKNGKGLRQIDTILDIVKLRIPLEDGDDVTPFKSLNLYDTNGNPVGTFRITE